MKSWSRVVAATLLATTLFSPHEAASAQSRGYTDADIHFMQGMIAHHAQAVRMAGLVPSRSRREAMHLLAERIDVSQRDEIRMMRQWLLDRHLAAPDPLSAPADTGMADMPGMEGMSHASGDTLMPGMLTPSQMRELAQATGSRFDRLFLTGMIRHHEGALAMVKHLFDTPGAAQDSQLFGFATDVVADQQAEIQRMRALLAKISPQPKTRS